jgi:hypothetical protein
MDSFSTTSLTTLLEAISQRIASSTGEIRTLLQQYKDVDSSDEHGDPTATLSALAHNLEHFQSQAHRLKSSVQSVRVVSERLQGALTSRLAQCDADSAVLGKQLMRLQPENLGSVNQAAVRTFEEVLSTYIALFDWLSNALSL